jgi:hypothetical protein
MVEQGLDIVRLVRCLVWIIQLLIELWRGSTSIVHLFDDIVMATTEAEDRFLVIQAKRNRFASATQLLSGENTVMSI